MSDKKSINLDLKNLPFKYRIFIYLLPLIIGLLPVYIFLAPKKTPDLSATQLTKLCGGSLLASSNSYTIESKYVPCYLDYFQKYAKEKGLDQSVERFKEYSLNTKGLMGECHSVGHALGAWAYKEYGDKAFNNKYADCAFAYGHGLLQQAALKLTPTQIVDKLSIICEQDKNISDCVHGFGHSLGQSTLDVIKVDQVCKALNDKLSKYATRLGSSALHALCTEGWIMEKYTEDPMIWSKDKTIEEALQWCAGISGYGEAGCNGIAIRNYINASKDKGYNTTPETISRLNEFVTYCSKVAKEFHVICVQHLGMTIGEVYDLKTEDSIVAENYVKDCAGTDSYECQASFLNSRLSKLGNDTTRIEGFCKFLVGDFLANCKKVMGNPVQ
jgi:hypothetical protein